MAGSVREWREEGVRIARGGGMWGGEREAVGAGDACGFVRSGDMSLRANPGDPRIGCRRDVRVLRRSGLRGEWGADRPQRVNSEFGSRGDERRSASSNQCVERRGLAPTAP